MTYALCSASRSRKLMTQVSHVISLVTDYGYSHTAIVSTFIVCNIFKRKK